MAGSGDSFGRQISRHLHPAIQKGLSAGVFGLVLRVSSAAIHAELPFELRSSI